MIILLFIINILTIVRKHYLICHGLCHNVEVATAFMDDSCLCFEELMTLCNCFAESAALGTAASSGLQPSLSS